jgi:hypothetical protein
MSHIATVKVEINDLQSLKDACKAKGWTFKEGQKTYRWYGRWMNDTPMPEGWTHENLKTLGTCDHAISIPGASYEVGVRAKADGTFEIVWDFWSQGGLVEKLGGKSAPVLSQAYTVARAKNEAYRNGYAVESEDVLQDGSVRLRILARA